MSHELTLEMAWTPWRDSCRDPHITPDGDLRQCRRRRNHDDEHASGFGPLMRRWRDA